MVEEVCSLHGNIRCKKGQKMAKNEFSNNPDKELVNNNRYMLRNIILYIILYQNEFINVFGLLISKVCKLTIWNASYLICSYVTIEFSD